MIAHCLFEQSGTFKNEFKKLGIDAYDYDIQNEFGETDFQIDLFAEITKSYRGGVSIFDKIAPEDIILAFFPCVRFEDQIMVHMRGQCSTMQSWSLQKKLEYSMKLQHELTENYDLISMLVSVVDNKGLRMIIENPYSQQHYLKQYWPVQPAIIDKDRTQNGDMFKKPTQYFFIGCEPQNNLVFEPIQHIDRVVFKKAKSQDGIKRGTIRSMIQPQYASRFIRQYILPKEDKLWHSQHCTN